MRPLQQHCLLCRSSMAPARCGPAVSKSNKKGTKRLEAPKGKNGSVSPPLKVTVNEQLSPLDRTNQPIWSTFCGVTNGVWQGKTAAFYAATGDPEPVYMEGKTKVYDLHTLVVEERPEDDLIVRRTLRSPRLSDVRSASLTATVTPDGSDDSSDGQGQSSMTGSTSSEQDWDTEMLTEGEEGLIIFDGGTFSRGSLNLVSTPESSDQELDSDSRHESEEGPTATTDPATEALSSSARAGISSRTVTLVEQCLAWGGEQRIRLRLTLSSEIENGELDIEVLRLALWREAWQGLSEECAVDRCVAQNVQNPSESTSELSTAERVGPQAFEGVWKAYDLIAVPTEDTDPLTGEREQICIYFGQETSQSWAQSSSSNPNDGAAIWLPNKVLVELQMVPPSSRGFQADRAEGMQEESARGFLITFSWAVKENTIIGVQREYDAKGCLLECRNRTAVQGSWVGGRM